MSPPQVGIRLNDMNGGAQVPRRIAVILNPYDPNDPVYLPNEAEREEYLNNDHGITYRGTSRVRLQWNVYELEPKHCN